jgi:hypothetical protein
MTGTYQLQITSDGGGVGTTTLRVLSIPPDLRATATIDGPPVTLSASAGQNAAVIFQASAGQTVTVEISGSLVNNGAVAAQLSGPGGAGASQTRTRYFFNRGPGLFVTGNLQVTGFYTLKLNLIYTPGTVTVSLHSTTPDAIVPLTVDGGPASTLLSPGQRLIFTFGGTGGETVSISLPVRQLVGVVYTSSGEFVTNCIFNCSLTLPKRGSYRIDAGINSLTSPVVVTASVSSQ